MPRTFRVWLAGAALVAAGCTDRATVEPIATTPFANVTSETSTDFWRSIITGETGPGSVSAIYVPRSWNGDVVFYAHGIRDVLDPVGLQDQDGYSAIRDQLGALGYAVAYSSFSENGYAVVDAAQRTHQLRGLFVSQFGKPAHSYLLGHSLGALAVLKLADEFSNQYDGVVSACGVVGGTQAQLDYAVNVRALFDVFYPGILPGSAAEPVPGYDLRTDVVKQGQIVAAVSADPVHLAVIASTAQTPLEFTNSNELVTSLINALVYHTRGADNVLTFTHGKFPVSNRNLTYKPRQDLPVPLLPPAVLAALLAQANSQIDRFDADRAGVVWAANNYTPSGSLRLPTITLHKRWDRLVPFFHEGIYRQRVIDAGRTDLLLQRTVMAYGHCEIAPATLVQAITDLATWVTTGVKPAN